jgi:hypothetical protein
VTSDLSELARELKDLGVPENHYSIGVNQNERICIVFDGAQWIVYYSERGRMENLREFLNFADAKIEFLNQVI